MSSSTVPALLGGVFLTIVYPFVFVLVPGLIASVLWSPIVAYSRLRSLFRELPLTRSTSANYLIAMFALSWPWIGIYWWAMFDMRLGNSFVPEAIVLSGLNVVGIPLIAGIGLPRFGIDWDPHGYGVGTWFLLAISSAWFTAIYTVSILFFTSILLLASP